ncbi:MAG: ethylbenzene dehydrogenase-related protein [Armatimonadota bacterium]|nr:ethylbenzene dehydrogenase-related protein [Armatimonadota bacterium]MDR7486306.1 ethylbenzene dehydrogenase-related protein [Armatimonadota bacterium]MDR7532281.1 ethylbenzene dehydrogenase-related protein [Armatimonadota bacterium]MDR7537246.1 ethylbenzene dehydrogenase-related protein [Armatimonadota bacterium]
MRPVRVATPVRIFQLAVRLAGGALACTLALGVAVLTAVGQTQQPPIVVRYTSARVPVDPAAAEQTFAQAQTRVIPLVPQNVVKPFGGGAVREVRVRALHDGKMLYWELSWADATEDRMPPRATAFTDALAVQFPVRYEPGRLPSPIMGEAARPVNIWQWKAAWQDDLTRGRDLRAAFPNMFVDYYYDVHLARTAQARAGFNAGLAAGNPVSRLRRTSAAEDLVAWGYGTLTHQPRQDVVGFGRWRGGRWTVVLARPLATPDEMDAQFQPGGSTVINFAVWDGSHEERNGQKNVTLVWWEVRLEPVP